jgi:TatA/E family protein of Tat protein translocase
MANTGECIIPGMFGTLGGPELVLILVLALIVFGPRKLPEIGKSMGKMLAEFRKASHEFQRTIEDEVEAEKARPPLPPSPAPAPEAPAARPPAEATVSREPGPDPIEPK